MDLAVYIENMVRGFSRYNKYSIGAELRGLSREALRLVISANSSEDKFVILIALRDTFEQLKVTILICKEVKAFKSFSSFQYAAEAAVNLSRQSEGWLKSVRRKNNHLAPFVKGE